MAKALMIQGTASHVGKSVLVTALGRLLRRRGWKVAPFKAVNMSNNAWVTRDGGEMAVAQAAQAKACGVEPTVEMNPVLLKPMEDRCSQVIVLGRPAGILRACDFARWRPRLLEAIDASLEKLKGLYDLLLVEGAGSPAEINLKESDLANMAVARRLESPVLLAADIDRGGVFAQLIGTLELLEPEDRDRVCGFLINKFRGDPQLLEPGLVWLQERTGKPVLGVIPVLNDLAIPEEDALAERLTHSARSPSFPQGSKPLKVRIIRYPTIANFTDFDPLHREPDLQVEYLTRPPTDGDRPDLLILPGSKSTMADLRWLRGAGFEPYLRRCVEERVEVLGVCGGFQMLGGMIYDPQHLESSESAMPGLGLLPTDTLFLGTKVTAQVKGIHLDSGEPVTGYEIHIGRLQGARRGKPVFRLKERGGAPADEWDGCRLPDRPVWGTYLHGLFESDRFRRWFLGWLRPSSVRPEQAVHPSTELRMNGASKDNPYDALADAVQAHLRKETWESVLPWIPLR